MMHVGQIEPVTIEEAVKANLDWYWSDVESTLKLYPNHQTSWYEITEVKVFENDKYWLVQIDNDCPNEGILSGGDNIVVNKTSGEILSWQGYDPDDWDEVSNMAPVSYTRPHQHRGSPMAIYG